MEAVLTALVGILATLWSTMTLRLTLGVILVLAKLRAKLFLIYC